MLRRSLNWLLLPLTLYPSVITAQTDASPSAPTQEIVRQGGSVREGIHVVRPGDTLEDLAAQYLGSRERWKEIWERNKDIANPHVLRPGDKVVLPFRQLPQDSAFVAKAANQVDQWRPPLKKEAANVFDMLRSLDQVETGKRSSAEITFSDSSVLRLNEESKVVLELAGGFGSTVERESVELITGQADLEGRSSDDSANSGIQLVFGAATARPTPSEDGKIAARVRVQDATSQLMVYEGSSSLAAGGKEVAVAQGMGSSAKKGEAPSPPEKLLPAPALVSPADGDALATPRPGFFWDVVPGAATYTVEICRDAVCGAIERRRTGLKETEWLPEDKLPKRSLHWRVTAQAASGLDGYPAPTRGLDITSDEEDRRPPTVAFKAHGTYMAPRYGLNRHWILAPGAGFEALVGDGESGLDRWIPLLDGETIDAERWAAGPWESGRAYELSLIAVDRAANRATLEPIPFKLDDQGPRLSWGLERLGRRGAVDLPEDDIGNLPWHPSRQTVSVDDPHDWLPWRKQTWTIDRDPRQVVLRPNRPVRVSINDRVELILTPERGLWVLAEDPISGQVRRMDYRLTLNVEGGLTEKWSRLTIEMEAEDPVKNLSQGIVRLRTLGRAEVEEPAPSTAEPQAPAAAAGEG